MHSVSSCTSETCSTDMRHNQTPSRFAFEQYVQRNPDVVVRVRHSGLTVNRAPTDADGRALTQLNLKRSKFSDNIENWLPLNCESNPLHFAQMKVPGAIFFIVVDAPNESDVHEYTCVVDTLLGQGGYGVVWSCTIVSVGEFYGSRFAMKIEALLGPSHPTHHCREALLPWQQMMNCGTIVVKCAASESYKSASDKHFTLNIYILPWMHETLTWFARHPKWWSSSGHDSEKTDERVDMIVDVLDQVREQVLCLYTYPGNALAYLDLTPANVMFNMDAGTPKVKLIDMGSLVANADGHLVVSYPPPETVDVRMQVGFVPAKDANGQMLSWTLAALAAATILGMSQTMAEMRHERIRQYLKVPHSVSVVQHHIIQSAKQACKDVYARLPCEHFQSYLQGLFGVSETTSHGVRLPISQPIAEYIRHRRRASSQRRGKPAFEYTDSVS